MAKAFVIWGGYGGHNLGDEAILWALSRQLRRLEPSARQYVLVPHQVSDRVRDQYAAWKVEIVSGSLLRSLLILRRARLVVGGGQMVDDSSLGWPVGWSSLFLLINWLSGNKSLVLCIGAESLRRRLPRFLVRNVYAMAEVCTCRDIESSEILQDAGITERKIWTTRDVVFSLDRALLPQWSPTASGGGIKVAMLIAYDPKRIRETTERSSQLVDALLRSGVTVHLVAHDLRAEYDPRAVGELQAKYDGHPAVITPRAQSVDDVLNLYSECDAVISGRMHPLILAALVGTLPVAFGGKAKVRSLLAMSGIPALSGESAEEQSQELLQLLARRAELLPQIAEVLRDFHSDVETVMTKALAL
jgi:polysaccharide pyruvyl transferase WcaK-like protein